MIGELQSKHLDKYKMFCIGSTNRNNLHVFRLEICFFFLCFFSIFHTQCNNNKNPLERIIFAFEESYDNDVQ